jgi:hypothetical protein
MSRARREELALRREALAARATLQRIQITSALTRVRSSAVRPKTIAGLALRLAKSWAGGPTGQAASAPGVSPQPWMLSAGWLLLRALRASPTARWLVGAGAAGVAIWWVVKALRTPEGDDDSG